MKKHIQLITMSLLVGSFFLLSGCGKPKFHTLSGETMGTTYTVSAKVPQQVKIDELKSKIDARLDDINQSMSTYIADSEISLFNKLAVGEAMEISKDFAKVTELAKQVYTESEGAFDPTVATLVDLWGFGAGSKTANAEEKTPPSDEAIKAALTNTGFDKVVLADYKLSKTADVRIDYSGIAKGYGADQVAQLLRDNNINSFLVEVGGEIVTQGVSPRGGPWRIAVTAPKSLQSQISRLEMQDAGMATSGDYRNYFDYKGVRYSHTINPKTGYPVEHRLSSVTVMQETSAAADAWATALLVLGVDKGFALAEKEELPVYMIYRGNDGFALKHTGTMQRYFPKH